MSNHEEPKIRFVMPHCEAFEEAVATIRATGAHGEGDAQGRRFAIDGPMSISEVAAFLRLISATGLWDDGATLKFTIEGGPIVPTEFYGTADEWWAEQWGSAPPKYHRTH